jgi:xanthine/CO dehydrogenase XdhC/CoxF family maturation factor
MKELRAILAAHRMADNKRQAAIATVVKVKGSSYRSPGARMYITDDGKWVGSISGGCLEGDALRKARHVMMEKKAMTVTYDTREESNQNLGISLGCNGVIDVLIEPIASENDPIEVFEKCMAANQPVAIATIIRGNGTGEKLLMTNGAATDKLSNRALANDVTPLLKRVFDSKKTETINLSCNGEEFEVFLELIQPSVSLIVFGGGFDARPVSQLAKNVGWEVQVTDECVAHVAPIFFPQADKLSLCQREFIDRDFNITPYTACVLMSHNYEYDRDVLRKLITTAAPYIGILGPRKRFEKMMAEFKNAGLELSSEQLQRIHSPIGLDIGAEAADEIAISIIAEIQTKFTNRTGGFLRHNPGPIHQREPNSDQVLKQVYFE